MAEFIPLGLGGLRARAATRKFDGKPAGRSFERHELIPPPKPPRNFIPTQEAIESLLERALAALARGMIWDRGSIINLVL
jgi:hypothetical protein